MIIIPPYLKNGDTIGLTCPAGYMPAEKAQACIQRLQQWGYNVMVGKTLGSSSVNYFSGTDEERADELQAMLDDEGIHAILCARGGYGLGRIIDRLHFKQFKKKPKWIIGFSDITVLHAHINSNYGIATLHAPMAGAFNGGEEGNEYVLSLQAALEGRKTRYQVAAHPSNRTGEAVGELVGGNLTLISHLIGSSSSVKTKGRILFIEDTGELLYKIDRMMYQLKRSGKLDKLAALLVGGFTEMTDTERPFGKTVYEIIEDIVAEYDYPVCYNFPVSHQKENYAVKVGVGHKLKVGKNKVTLEE
ncbi:MAG TPA: LD-carboxypeptidase [Chitinophagaceae bacterium]|nr:LD-carboxypeptidase [Chitinophagaceae bacterium]